MGLYYKAQWRMSRKPSESASGQTDTHPDVCMVQGRLGRDPESDGSLAAHLLRLRDPDTGAPISDARLLPHIGVPCPEPWTPIRH